jgi:release factor glutamine methyltransferase
MTADATPQMQMKSAAAATVRSALHDAIAQLLAAETPSHALAAELLLMRATGRDRAWIYAHPEAVMDEGAARRFFELVAQRAAGTPTQYLTGRQEFWGLEFEVTPAVLIPRPETEHVIEVVLERLRPREVSSPLRVADVGTGSGCIAVALAKELPGSEIVATDISTPALEVARRNAERHGVLHRVLFVECDLLQGAGREAARFDVVVSNPPYVAREKESELACEVREHEPHEALFGGTTGIEIYARLIEQAAVNLRAGGGLLVLEIGYGAAERVRSNFDANLWADIQLANDLAGIPRVISAVRT